VAFRLIRGSHEGGREKGLSPSGERAGGDEGVSGIRVSIRRQQAPWRTRAVAFRIRGSGEGFSSFGEAFGGDTGLSRARLRTRHTLEPLAWHWSHWPGRARGGGRPAPPPCWRALLPPCLRIRLRALRERQTTDNRLRALRDRQTPYNRLRALRERERQQVSWRGLPPHRGAGVTGVPRS